MEAQKEKYGLQECIDRCLDNYELAIQLKEDLAQKFTENDLDFTVHSHNIEEVLLLDSDMNITINNDRFDHVGTLRIFMSSRP